VGDAHTLAPARIQHSLANPPTGLENQVRTLQARLDETAHKASASEANTVHLSQEHARSLKRLEAACAELNEAAEKLDSTQKRLAATEHELELSQQLNPTRSSSSEAALRREIEALKKENKRLEAEIRALRTELKTLRSDEDLTRKNHERLLAEIQSLRATNRTLLRETDDLRQQGSSLSPADSQSFRATQRALAKEADELRDAAAAARMESAALQQDVARLDAEKHALREDNESLVRHNDKYFIENKTLRKENATFERTLHELHDENLRLKDEVDFLKTQLDHCRPVDKEADLTGAADDLDEGMTSGFFGGDASVVLNEGGVGGGAGARGDHSSTRNAGGDATDHSTRQVGGDGTDHSTRNDLSTRQTTGDATTSHSVVTPEQSRQAPALSGKQQRGGASRGGVGNTSQKVAFSIPDHTDGGTPRPANVGSKRRSVSGSAIGTSRKVSRLGGVDLDAPADDTTGRSPEHTQEGASKEAKAKERDTKTKERERDTRTKGKDLGGGKTGDATMTRDLTLQRRLSRNRDHRNADFSADVAELAAGPSLSPSARRVLDNLCEHNCRNCTVCARISSHGGPVVRPSANAPTTKKHRVTVPRPIPVTERDLTSSTVRPATDPARALALVIKGLSDERDHINMRLARLQEQYGSTDPSVGRRARTSLAEQIRAAIASAEIKSDQIYHLNDVVVGLSRQGGTMDEDEMELTVFSITGAHVAEWMDVVGCE
jgi:predicted  nucleic acid-binding Zn-ribbon protein